MNIPNFLNSRIVDKEGYLTPEWSNLLQQLFTELQSNVSNEGYVVPSRETADINKLTAKNGAFLYDSEAHAAKVIVNGAVKTIQVA